LHSRGTIFHHPALVFNDGSGASRRKYLILLNTPSEDEPYLFIKATSQQKNKPKSPGCIEIQSLFFIPSGKTFFPKDTWLQLHDRYQFSKKDINPKHGIRVVGDLDAHMIEKIVDCLLLAEADDISPIDKELLAPSRKKSLSKLREMFKKR